MALQDADLLVVQQGATVYKMTVGGLATYTRDGITKDNLPIATETELGGIKVGDNLNITGDGTLSAVIPTGMDIKGMYSPDDDAPNAVAGDLYTMSKAGTLNNTWGALDTQVVSQNDAVIYTSDGNWDYLGAIFGGGVVSISGSAPITVSGGAETPIIGITAASGTADGSMSSADYTKLSGIAPGAQTGTVTTINVVSDRGLAVTNATTTPTLDLNTATKAVLGTVMFADPDAITNGTGLKAVDAAALKVVADKVSTLEGIEQVSVVAGTHTTVSEVSGTYTVDAKTAKESEAGVIQIATGTEVIAGTDTSKAVTSAAIKANYLPKDISTLQPLPA